MSKTMVYNLAWESKTSWEGAKARQSLGGVDPRMNSLSLDQAFIGGPVRGEEDEQSWEEVVVYTPPHFANHGLSTVSPSLPWDR